MTDVDDNVIITLRDYQVIERIKDFIDKHNLDPRLSDQFFQTFYRKCWPFKTPINSRTESLMFDEKLVTEEFALFDVDKLPKAPKDIPPT